VSNKNLKQNLLSNSNSNNIQQFQNILIKANYPEDYFDIPISFILKCDKINDKKQPNNRFQMEIQTKDNRTIKIIFNNESKKLYGELAVLLSPKDNSLFDYYAMRYREYHPVNFDGWQVYDMVREFGRQGVDCLLINNLNSQKQFRMTYLNKNFELCSSYPEKLIVPYNSSDDSIRESASFRTKSRIPVLCYYNKENRSSLWRSSQTKSGLSYQRNKGDEDLLKAIQENSTDKNKNLIIFDARPYLNAFANRFKGAGYENTDNYEKTEINFCEIDNIHCVRGALQKINTLISNPKFLENKKFLSMLEQTNWNDYIYQILKSSIDVAVALKSGNNVLIHCSDGWDRSSQLTSLSQILLDPFYRTIKGFMVLIEKEWLSFGHQFGLRSGFFTKELSEDQRSPIFLQWLDCVHQILLQFPHLFEFNTDFLLHISYHINSNKYGTFIYNNELERFERKVREKTVSIWTDVLELGILDKFINPFYSNSGNTNLKEIRNSILNFDDDMKNLNFKVSPFISPNFSMFKIKFWEDYFMRYLHFSHNYGKFYAQTKTGKKKLNSGTKYIEMVKKSDNELIYQQKEEIEKLNQVIKEISSKFFLKVEDFKKLSSTAQDHIADIYKGDLIEEDGFVVVRSNRDNVKRQENLMSMSEDKFTNINEV
jgi:hypothetical protein